jgi:Spy/CpxP family protein refolding chaperone
MVRFTRSKLVTFGAAALLVAAVAAGAAAQGPGGRRGPLGPLGPRGLGGPGPGGFGGSGGPGGGLPLGQLDLSEAQRSLVREITQKYAEQLKKAADQLRAAQDAQQDAIKTYPVNEVLVSSTAQALSLALTGVALVQAQMHHDLFSILTLDQQAKVQEIETKQEARMKERQQQMQQRRQLR